MKLIHLSDLHLGKRVNEFSMMEDQAYILKKILRAIDEEEPDAVLIAGDVYDKSVPSAEAVELFDDFLVRLASRSFRGRQLQTFVISGNHDSPERLAFGGRLMDASGVHLSPVFSGRVVPFPLTDSFGTVNFYMLPFVKPVHVRRFFPEEKIESYTDAVALAVRRMDVDPGARNVLIAHQFVTGAERSESEELSVGGLDNVDVSAFAGFDYVALGHIHGPQNVAENVRYCGTPLKYSFSEAKQEKSVTVVELGRKGEVTVRTIPLVPKREMVDLRGSYDELMSRSFYEGTTYPEDYVRITLTDETDVPEATARLRVVYHNLMKLAYDNTRTRHSAQIDPAEDASTRSPLEIFSELYEKQNGEKPNAEQQALLTKLIESIWEEEA